MPSRRGCGRRRCSCPGRRTDLVGPSETVCCARRCCPAGSSGPPPGRAKRRPPAAGEVRGRVDQLVADLQRIPRVEVDARDRVRLEVPLIADMAVGALQGTAELGNPTIRGSKSGVPPKARRGCTSARGRAPRRLRRPGGRAWCSNHALADRERVLEPAVASRSAPPSARSGTTTCVLPAIAG